MAIELQNWRKNAERVPPSVYTSADAFLKKCIPVFWDIVLQWSPLVLVTDHETFHPSQHQRFYGSDPNSNRIYYFAWPCLMEEAPRKVLVKGKVVTGKQEPTKPEDVADMLKDWDLSKRNSDLSVANSGNCVLEEHASVSVEVEEISDARQPSEIAKRFQDLFCRTYCVADDFESAMEELNERSIFNFIIDMLTVRRFTLIYSCIAFSLGCSQSCNADIERERKASSTCFRFGVSC